MPWNVQKYNLEFVLSAQELSAEEIARLLHDLGEGLEIMPLPQCDTERSRNFKVHLTTQDPETVFDACAEFGRIKSVKIT